MTNNTLKSVVILDPEIQGYRPAGHNLAHDDALLLVKTLAAVNRSAKVLDQGERHRSSDPTKCRACKKAAEQTSLQSESDAHETTRDTAASEG